MGAASVLRTKAGSEVVVHPVHLGRTSQESGFSGGDFTCPEGQIVQSVFSAAHGS